MAGSIFRNIPGRGSGSFKDPVANFASLPTTGNIDGDIRVTLDTHTIYVWNEGTSTWTTATGGVGINSLNGLVANSQSFAVPGNLGTSPNWVSSGSTHTLNIPQASSPGVAAGLVSKTEYDVLSANKYHVEKFTLSASDIVNKYVTLSNIPTTANKTRLIVVDGIEQDYSADFTVSGNQISWNGLTLETILEENDKLIILYN